MASQIVKERTIDERAARLRGALGFRTPSGFLPFQKSSIAWYRFPTPASGPLDGLAREEPPIAGQTIVGLHHLGSGSREFQPLMPMARSGTRLIFFDWPLHGRSTSAPGTALSLSSAVDLLRTLLRELGIVRPILVGCGFGAAVALEYSVRFPGQILALALCQPAGLVPRRRAPSLPALHADLGRITQPAARRQALRTLAVSRLDTKPNTDVKPGTEMEASLETSLGETDLSAPVPSLRSALAAGSCPTLAALSRDSRQYRLNDYLKLFDPARSAAPQHWTTVFDGNFHPIWDEPGRFMQALNALLQAQLPFDQHRHAWLLKAVDWPTRSINLWQCAHPECHAEQALAEGLNANDAASPNNVPTI
jgi:pimeloyl-ACP methyl ester carboxylesterase